MTTTIFANLIAPFCELYYKTKASNDIQQYYINTIRNYGSVDGAINFGFEPVQQIPYNQFFTPNISLGVFTINNAFNFQNSFSVSNSLKLPEVQSVGIITYINKTLPVVISISTSGNQVIGFTTGYLTGGIPYNSNSSIDQNIIRNYESSFVQNYSNSILIFYNFQNATIVSGSGSTSLTPNSLYSYQIKSYRTINGYGQFNSLIANQSFIPNSISTSSADINSIYKTAYALVYNWKNLLTWSPDFNAWYSINSSSTNIFLKKFLQDYFGI